MSYSETIEIEKKFYTPDRESILSKLKSLDWKENPLSIESDTYLTDRDGKFIRNRTCLRSRFREGTQTFTLDYKPASETNNSFFIKKESNIEFPQESYWGVFELLNNLGFYKYITVEKHRRSFSKRESNREATVTLDEIIGIGLFIELELTIPVENKIKEDASDLFNAVFSDILSLDLLEPVYLPYRDIVAKKFNDIWLSKKDRIYIDWDGYISGAKILEESGSSNINTLESLAAEAYMKRSQASSCPLPLDLGTLSKIYEIILVCDSSISCLPEGVKTSTLEDFTPMNNPNDLYLSASEAFSSKLKTLKNSICLSYKERVKSRSDMLHIDSLKELLFISQFAEKF